MKKRNNSQQSPNRTPKGAAKRSLTIGMDLGDKTSRYCVLDRLDQRLQRVSHAARCSEGPMTAYAMMRQKPGTNLSMAAPEGERPTNRRVM